MKKNSIIMIAVILILAMVFVACAPSTPQKSTEGENKNQSEDSKKTEDSKKAETSTQSGQKFKIMLAGTGGEKDTQSIGMMEVEKRLEESGLFDVECFFASALGGTDDVMEQGLQGVPVVAMSDPGRLAAYVKEFGVIQMPYILEDPEDLDKLIESDLYKGWIKKFEEQNIKVITSNWYNGARNMVLNAEVKQPSDLNGKKIRTIGNELFVSSIEAMGAIPTPMEWAEVYPSIQQGGLDGCEAQTPSVYASRIYEICNTINKTEHFQLITVPVMGKGVFDSWTPEAQEVFVKTFVEVGRENRKIVNETIAKYEAEMAKDKGMKILEVDKSIFKAATEPVYEKLGYVELREEFLKAIGRK